jgi:transcriptional regulator with XRE-family HTH domain
VTLAGTKQHDPGFGLAGNLSKLRKERNMTHRALADLVGVSASFISNIEMGKVANPGAYHVYRLALALRVPMEDLMGVSRLASRTRMRSYPDERIQEIIQRNSGTPLDSTGE